MMLYFTLISLRSVPTNTFLLTNSTLDSTSDSVGSVFSHVSSGGQQGLLVGEEGIPEGSRRIVVALVLVDTINALNILRVHRATLRSAFTP